MDKHYVFPLGANYYMFQTRDSAVNFLKVLFDSSINRRVLYIELGNNLLSVMGDDILSVLQIPSQGVDMSDAVSNSLLILSRMYGDIYDPDHTVFSITDGTASRI